MLPNRSWTRRSSKTCGSPAGAAPPPPASRTGPSAVTDAPIDAATKFRRSMVPPGAGKPSAPGDALGVHEQRVERRGRAQEQAVSMASAEAEVGAALRQLDAADELARGVVDVHAVEALLAHAPADPEVAV